MAQNQSLSTQEVADILHVSKSTIYDLIRKGEIHSYKIGRKVRFTQEDVDELNRILWKYEINTPNRIAFHCPGAAHRYPLHVADTC